MTLNAQFVITQAMGGDRVERGSGKILLPLFFGNSDSRLVAVSVAGEDLRTDEIQGHAVSPQFWIVIAHSCSVRCSPCFA